MKKLTTTPLESTRACFVANDSHPHHRVALSGYQSFTGTTNCYPHQHMLECLVLGLCSEAGEVAGKIKKLHRGDGVSETVILDEVGDCLWYISELCTHFNVTLDDLMVLNQRKLTNRVRKGTIKGCGDER